MSPRRRPSIVAAWAAVVLATALLGFGAADAHEDLAHHRSALSAASTRAPDDVALWLTQAELARIARDFPAAHAALDRAAALTSSLRSLPSLARCRAALALDEGDPRAARALVERTLAAGNLSPDDASALEFLAARIAESQDLEADALAAYDRALALAPRPTAEAFLSRAGLARAFFGAEESARGLAVACARLPYDGALRDALALDLATLGRHAEAGELLAGWRAASPGDAAPAGAPVVASAPVPGGTLAPTLVARGATWRWSATGVEPSGWKTLPPGDTSWPAGPAPLGFGDPFIVTTIPTGPTSSVRYTTSYFRIVFDLAVPPATLTGLTLSALYDDGFVAYLNGVEIARRGLGAGAVGYSTFAAQHEATAYEAIDVSAARPLLVAGSNVLAVEVHQATSASSDLTWDAGLVAFSGAPGIVRGPYLQNGASDAMTVRWRTDVATDSRVWLGAAPGALVPAVTDPTPVTEHELRLTGLTPETTYAYAVGSTAGVLAGDDTDHVFRTPPAPGDGRPTRIWVLGDSGLPGAGQNRVRDAYVGFTGATPTDVWLMLGDNAYQTGTDAEYGAGLFTPYAAFLRSHPLWPTRGNHDAIHAGGANDYYDLFTLPTAGEAGGTPSSTEAWYSFDHGDVHFVCLDSEGSSRAPGSPMLTWLAGDLAANQRTWTIVFFHHPPYTKGSHDSDNVGDSEGRMRDMRENVMPLLEAAGVDLVLGGHSHSYERSFLLDGHYGTSGTLTPAMILDSGDGDPGSGGDGPYVKSSPGAAPHEGEVVAVAGSSAHISGGTLNHPAMARSLNVLGSMVIDVAGPVLDGGASLVATFLDDLGAVRDRFSIVKGVPIAAGDGPGAAPGALALRVAGANPFHGTARLAFELPRAGEVDIRLIDASGRLVRRLASGAFPAGSARVTWDGNDESGRRMPAGLYFAILDVAGNRRVARLLRLD